MSRLLWDGEQNEASVYFSVEVWIWYIDTDPEYMLNRQIQSRHTWTQPSQRELLLDDHRLHEFIKRADRIDPDF